MAEKTITLKTAEGNLKTLTSQPTTDAAKVQIVEIEKRKKTNEEKLELLRNSTEVISAEEKKILLDEHEKLLREYR